MSLGFLTESTILPSKSKKISINSESVLDLKALVYEKEQQRSSRKSNGSSAAAITRKAKEPSSKRSMKKQRRRKREEDTEELREKEAHRLSQLEKKAKIYDSLKKDDVKGGRVTSQWERCTLNATEKTYLSQLTSSQCVKDRKKQAKDIRREKIKEKQSQRDVSDFLNSFN